MNLCWDNIENLYLVKSKKYFRDRKTKNKYIVNGPCKNCNNFFLSQPQAKGDFCSHTCASTNKYNGRWKGGYRKDRLPMYDTYKHKLKKYHNIRRCLSDKNILEIDCCICGKYHIPSLTQVVDRIKWIETGKRKENKFYCSDACKKKCKEFGRKKYIKGYEKIKPYPKGWSKISERIKIRDNYKCQNPNCKYKNEIVKKFNITTHHIDYNKNNCDDDNLITLCRSCNSIANHDKKYYQEWYYKIIKEKN